MSILAAGEFPFDWGVFTWLVGLGLAASAGSAGILVARALHARALSQLEAWKKKIDESDFLSRLKAVEAIINAWKDDDFITRLRDTQRLAEETHEWRQTATEQLDEIKLDRHAAAEVEKALAAAQSTTHGIR